jgi:hypothetical protein
MPEGAGDIGSCCLRKLLYLFDFASAPGALRASMCAAIRGQVNAMYLSIAVFVLR